MATISKQTKMVIINDILTKMYGEKLKKSNEKVEAFAQEAIKSTLSKNHEFIEKALGKEARNYVHRMNRTGIYVAGRSEISRPISFSIESKGIISWSTSKRFLIDFFIPIAQQYNSNVSLPAAKNAKYEKLVRDSQAIRDSITGEFHSLVQLMSTVRTEKKLLELFPDAGKYVSPKPVQATLPVPMAQVKKYNQALK